MKICQNCVLKICQKFVETNFFPIFLGINLFRGRGYTCINSFILKHPTATKVKSFFYEFIQEVWNHQELFVADILVLIKNVLQKNFISCAYQDNCYGKSVLSPEYFKQVVIKIFEKYILRSSFLEMKNLNQILEHQF